jgi:hypothetical protein
MYRCDVGARPPEEPLEPDLADLCDLCETDQWESQRQIRRADGVLVVFCVCPCCGDAYDGAAPLRGPSPLDDEAIEAIRSDEAVRDAFVECYTLQGIISENGMNASPGMIADWDRVESALVRAILAGGLVSLAYTGADNRNVKIAGLC